MDPKADGGKGGAMSFIVKSRDTGAKIRTMKGSQITRKTLAKV